MAKRMVLTKPCVINTMAGRQTQDRRIIRPQPEYEKSQDMYWWKGDWDTRGGPRAGVCTHGSPGNGEPTWTLKEIAEHAHYQVGDEVYVAEGYQIQGRHHSTRKLSGYYLADNKTFNKAVTEREYSLWIQRQCPYRPTPGRFMYQSLARTFMTITEVGVEQVQDISIDDLWAEGFDIASDLSAEFGEERVRLFAYEWFKKLWDSIHGDGAWDRNDWVFVYKWGEIRSR